MSSTTPEEMGYPQLLNSASMCAHSESCSLENAEYYLQEIVHIQSGCAAGTLAGNAVCDDVLGVSEVVADLRQKIGEGAKREVRTFWDQRQEEMEILAAASMEGGPAVALKAPLKPAFLALAALYAIAIITVFQPATMDASSGGVVPFTAQEVWWSVRDGFVGDLANHLFRNGGLAVSYDDTAVSAVVGNTLSPQELMWSIRDGYAENTIFASNAVGGGVQSEPFTPQEVWWAIQHGYSYDMIAHWAQNGGLVV